MATLDPHKTYKATGYLYLTLDGSFEGISKECISLLRMDYKYIEKK